MPAEELDRLLREAVPPQRGLEIPLVVVDRMRSSEARSCSTIRSMANAWTLATACASASAAAAIPGSAARASSARAVT